MCSISRDGGGGTFSQRMIERRKEGGMSESQKGEVKGDWSSRWERGPGFQYYFNIRFRFSGSGFQSN